jgi:ubiquinone/menaquinone biosynthesis C-methylase UbiE
MSQPKGYVDPEYLQSAAHLLAQTKQRSYTFLHLQPGYNVLEVGYGPGTDTIPLAQLVGPTGQVVGADYDEGMLTRADQRARQAGVSAWVKHERANATALPFAAGRFDACRCERLLLHLLHPEQALAEMARVTKVGGWVVVLETDLGTASIDASEVDIERRLIRCLAEQQLNNGYAGRQLYRLFKRQPLLDIAVELFPHYLTAYQLARQIFLLDQVEPVAFATDLITQDELHRWQTSLEQADRDELFFASFSMVLVAGRNP